MAEVRETGGRQGLDPRHRKWGEGEGVGEPYGDGFDELR